MKKNHTVRPVPQAESPLRRLPLVDLLVDTRTELLELVTRSGLAHLLEEDRTALCGPRYAHEPARSASRPRTPTGEVPLPTFQTMAQRDPLDRRVVEQMLVGVATR